MQQSVDEVVEEVESGEMKPPFVDSSPSINPNQSEVHSPLTVVGNEPSGVASSVKDSEPCVVEVAWQRSGRRQLLTSSPRVKPCMEQLHEINRLTPKGK